MTTIDSLAHLSDEQLLMRVHTLADDERRATVALIAALAELDARKLYLRQGCSSLFTYCTQVPPERYKLQVTLSAEAHQKLRRAQDLLRHAVPNGDLGVIVDRALTVLVQELERAKFAETTRPRKASVAQPRSRHIPAEVRRRVWHRDGGRCAFVGTEGRSAERGFLEFHHVLPYADGGESVVDNLELRCRAHNAYEAARWEGTLFAREIGDRDCDLIELGLDRVSPCVDMEA